MTIFKKILEEVKSSQTEQFLLCELSETFKKLWNSSNQVEIMSFVDKFLNDTKNQEWVSGKGLLLFHRNMEATNNKQRLDIRIEFLEWCVKNKIKLSYEPLKEV